MHHVTMNGEAVNSNDYEKEKITYEVQRTWKDRADGQ